MINLTEKLQTAFTCFQAGDLREAERLCGEILREARSEPGALHLLGVVRLTGGSPAEAATLISRALEGSPRNATMKEHLGLARLATRDYAAAETLFRDAIALGAAHGVLYMRLGLALSSQGKLADAVTAMREAAARSPRDPDVLLNLANALAVQGRNDEALECYRELLVLQPQHPVVHFNLGTFYKNLGRWDDAAAAFGQALAIAPDDADTHNNLGLVYEQQQRLDDAASSFQRALALVPGLVAARNNLGNVLRAQGRLDEAVACFGQVLAASPDHLDAHVNLGIARMGQGRLDDARRSFEEALRLDPRCFEAHNNLGGLLGLQGRAAAAIAHFRRAIETGGRQAMVHGGLAAAYRQTGELDAATAAYTKALELEPHSAELHYQLAETLKLQGRLDEAIAMHERALALDPDHVPALGGLVYLRQHVCSWQGIEELWAQVRARIASGRPGFSPFSTLSMPLTAPEQLACATAAASREFVPSGSLHSPASDTSAARSRDRIRIGYLSWGFHRHATSYLTAELFELHDRGRFEIHAYDYGPDDRSAIRSRIRDACDRFVHIEHEAHLDAARRIHDDGVDILVDLTGYTLGARPQILALRPAPVQVNWLGYPGTMGTDCIDYIVADPYIIPEGREADYAETVVRLPHCYQISDRKREASERTPTREECGLPKEGFVFCCFNQAYKILPETFGSWMRIVQAVPHSVLWLAEANPWATENLRRAATASGVAADRLVFAPRKELPEYLAALRIADLALDTFPYGSHTTASDALWMGCPLVTRAGTTFASRVAGSILTSAGLAQCVAETPEEYERLAIELAGSGERLAALRRKVQAARAGSPLFDVPRRVRDLEAAYERMVAGARSRAGGIVGGIGGDASLLTSIRDGRE